MALNKSALQTSLESIFNDLNPEKTPADVAQQMADAIDTFVKSGTVSTTVTGTTSPAVPGAPSTVTGTGTGSIS